MSWTDERINLLKKMWKEGKSAAEIAKTLGKSVTRNAVIGKAHRMGLSGRPSPIKKPPTVKKEAIKKSSVVAPSVKLGRNNLKPSAKAGGKNDVSAAKDAEEPVRFEKEAIPPGGGVALIDLTERMCKWPIGDPRDDDFTFCGRSIRIGTPYCADHASMAYQTSSRRGQVAVAAVQEKDDEEEVAVADGEVLEDDEDEEETVA